jgi:hypothetical protein
MYEMDLSRNKNDLLTIESARAGPATGKGMYYSVRNCFVC